MLLSALEVVGIFKLDRPLSSGFHGDVLPFPWKALGAELERGVEFN